MSKKYVQISIELWKDLFCYFMLDFHDHEDKIKKELKNKLDLMINHELYTKYKTGATEEEREAARKAYLDSIGIKDSFRW